MAFTIPLSCLDLWHLLSLDAPSVAVLWMLLVNQTTGWQAGWTLPLALFVAVWMLYAGDRLLDAQPVSSRGGSPVAAVVSLNFPDRSGDLEARHHFHHRHRGGFLVGIGTMLAVLAVLLFQLPTGTLEAEAVLGALLAGWLLLVHGPTRPGRRRRLPKELPVGLFFAAAVYLPVMAHAPQGAALLLPGACLFAGLCTLNCVFLYAWEHAGDRTQAHPATQWALRRLLPLAFALLFLSLAASVAMSRPWSKVPAACFCSTGLLLLLHRIHRQVPRLRLRALADLALLSPGLFLLPFNVPALWGRVGA